MSFLLKNLKIIFVLVLLTNKSYSQEQKKIVILDTGINVEQSKPYFCTPNLNKDFTYSSMEDTDEHGEVINSIISNNLSHDYCIINIKVISHVEEIDNTLEGLKYLNKLKNVVYVNISWGGIKPSTTERQIINNLGKKKVNLFICAGNDKKELRKDFCEWYPACYNQTLENHYVIGSSYGQYSNYGPIVDLLEPGFLIYNRKYRYGTSFATPQALKKHIDEHTNQ